MALRVVKMRSKRYAEEFKIRAVRQVTERGYSDDDVASRMDVTTHSLNAWLRKYVTDANKHRTKAEEPVEIIRLKKELKRVTEERDILKKTVAYFACNQSVVVY